MNNDSHEQGPNLIILSGIVASGFIAFIIGMLRLIGKIPPVKSPKEPSPGENENLEAQPGSSPPAAVPTYPPAVSQSQSQHGTSRPRAVDLSPEAAKSPPEQPLPQPGASTRWSTPTKYLVGILILLTAIFILYISRSVLSLFIFAALIAFIIQPITGFFQRRFNLKRGLSVTITYILVSVLLLLLPLIFVPAIVNAVNLALEIDYHAILENTVESIANLSAQVESIPILGSIVGPAMESLVRASESLTNLENPESLEYDASLATLGSRLAQTLGLLVNVFGPLVSAIVSFVFMILISIHMSLSGDKLRQWYPTLLPPAYRQEIEELVNRIEKIWASFLRGQLVLMTTIGAVVWLGNLILGTPQAFFLGVTAGLLEIIPNLGPLLATLPAVFLALFFGSNNFAINNLIFALIVIGFYILVQVLENQVLVPMILGDAVDLPPVVVIIGVVVGGAAAGILGIFLSTPIIATGREILGYLYKKILEPPPPEAPPEERPSLGEMIQGWVRGIKLPFRRKSRQRRKIDAEE